MDNFQNHPHLNQIRIGIIAAFAVVLFTSYINGENYKRKQEPARQAFLQQIKEDERRKRILIEDSRNAIIRNDGILPKYKPYIVTKPTVAYERADFSTVIGTINTGTEIEIEQNKNNIEGWLRARAKNEYFWITNSSVN